MVADQSYLSIGHVCTEEHLFTLERWWQPQSYRPQLHTFTLILIKSPSARSQACVWIWPDPQRPPIYAGRRRFSTFQQEREESCWEEVIVLCWGEWCVKRRNGLSPLWSVGGLSVSDRDVSQLGSHLRCDCFSNGNPIPLTHLNESSRIGFLSSRQDTKAASGGFSTRPAVLLWRSVKPLSLIIQGVGSAKQIWPVQRLVPRLVIVSRQQMVRTLLAAMGMLRDLLCSSWLLLWMCTVFQNAVPMHN